jgi:hypothetical protein
VKFINPWLAIAFSFRTDDNASYDSQADERGFTAKWRTWEIRKRSEKLEGGALQLTAARLSAKPITSNETPTSLRLSCNIPFLWLGEVIL